MGFMPARWPHDPLSREAPKVSRESFLEGVNCRQKRG